MSTAPSTPDNTIAPAKRFANKGQIAFLAVYFTFIGVLLLQNVYGFWPDTVKVSQDKSLLLELNARQIEKLTDELKAKEAAKDTLQPQLKQAILKLDSVRYKLLTSGQPDPNQIKQVTVKILSWTSPSFPVDTDHSLLLLVLVMGAVGSWLHAVSSFLDFVGNRNFVTSWITWYLMRPILGAIMAVVFYVVVRAGLFTNSSAGLEAINPFSIAAIAGLVGLFTQRAAKKLADVFDALFPTQQKDKDPLEPKPQPVSISQLNPAQVSVGAENQVVQVSGNNFTSKTTAFVNGEARSTSFVSKESISFNLLPKDVAEAGALAITVYDPALGGAPGEGVSLPVVAQEA